MKFTLLALFALSIFACTETETTETINPLVVETEPAQEAPPKKTEYTVATFQNETKDWGYEIIVDGKLFIHQAHIPAQQGIKGFSTEEKALKTGNFMVYKLNMGMDMPTVNLAELDSLKVLD